MSLLTPERLEGETYEQYKTRRKNAANYVEAQKEGDLEWTPGSGLLVNRQKREDRVFGKGKAARKMLKRAKQIMREQEHTA